MFGSLSQAHGWLYQLEIIVDEYSWLMLGLMPLCDELMSWLLLGMNDLKVFQCDALFVEVY